MEAAQGVWSVLVAATAVAVPAALGYYYFASQRKWQKTTVTTALRSEISGLNLVLQSRLRWIAKPQSRNLPLAPFDTTVYDSHLTRIGMLDSDFAGQVVRFYGQIHFVNALQKVRLEYKNVNEEAEFLRTYSNAVNKAISYIPSL